ncbi:hypothetical protein M2138_000236 [Dysgonomonadaceae bacterium PH5-43]|nr:hypothetical protein [Dysgonomonadaceae bacterium PH5-43]
MNRIYFILTLITIPFICSAQVKEQFSFQGAYKNKSAQGMAIHKNTAFLLNNGGLCRVFDLKKKKLISEFNLASADEKNHVNCAAFGPYHKKGNKKYPTIYISECSGKNRCFVESINNEGSELIQTLEIQTNGHEQESANWFIDKKKKCIYTISLPYKNDKTKESTAANNYLITKLPLPPLDSTEVIFTEKDIIEQFEISFSNLLQGGVIHKNCLYLPVGLHDYNGSEKRTDKERAVIVVNLTQKRIEKKIYIGDIVLNEPEDVDFYKGKLLLYCGQSGGLYNIPLK